MADNFHVMADNFHVTIQADMELLAPALKLACTWPTLAGYRDVTGSPATLEFFIPSGVKPETRRLILFWSLADGVIPFLAPLKPEQLTEYVKAWLGSVDYGRRPNHDGDNGKGFYLTTGQSWNHIEDFGHYACMDIRPCWMMYGK